MVAVVACLLAVALKPGNDPFLFLGSQPVCVLGSIRQISQRYEAKNYGGNPFDKKKPLPTSQTDDTVHLQKKPRTRPANDSGDRCRRHEPRYRPASRFLRKPISQVKNHAGKETCLRDTE